MNLRKTILLALFLTGPMMPGFAQGEPYKDPSLSADERARDLLSRMTLEEKISQMVNGAPAIERLGVLPYDWWNEALHGVARAGTATVFPQTIGLAATFDVEGVHEVFSMVSDEARAKHHDFKSKNSFRRYQGLTFWTPNINIYRDPRWGRGQESYGEDPHLTTLMGLAAIRGLQGDNVGPYDKAHACAKHYAVHSGPEWNRHSYDAKNISQRDLWETYMPAFKAAVTEGGVKEVMCAYNRFEGVPCCGSHELLIDILRNKWGFEGLVVSDCGGIDDFWQGGKHETHAGPAEASADAVIAGTDLNCGNTYRFLGEAVERGLITEQQIDQSVFRLMRDRFQLGMFDDDSLVPWASIPMSVVESKEHVEKALDMARKSMVLLENKNATLPLSKGMKVAVIGPNAADSVMLWANYNGFPTKSVTILEGIESKLPAGSVIYEKGCDYVEHRVFTDKLNRCSFDGKPGVKGTFWNTTDLSGEIAAETMFVGDLSFDTRGNIVFASGVNLNDFSSRFETTYFPDEDGETVLNIFTDDGYRVYIDGKEVISDWKRAKKAAKEYTFQVVKGRPVAIVIEHFHGEGLANLTITLGYARETDYAAVARKAAEADAIVFVGGISARIEGEEMRIHLPGFKRGDRTRIELPEVQQKMLRALKETGKPVVFVLCSGSSMAMPWESENLDAIVAAWYPGQQGGTAVADVLFGDYNPSGRTPLTFYTSTEELPDYEDYDMTKGRTYRYYRGTPLYPFGHGLSYTSFEYGKAKLKGSGDKRTLEIELRNEGAVAGDEVVQIYIRNLQDSEGPLKTLKAFKRVSMPAGTKEKVSVELPDSSFEFFDPATQQMAVKPGRYEILYGGSSDDLFLKNIHFQLK